MEMVLELVMGMVDMEVDKMADEVADMMVEMEVEKVVQDLKTVEFFVYCISNITLMDDDMTPFSGVCLNNTWCWRK